MGKFTPFWDSLTPYRSRFFVTYWICIPKYKKWYICIATICQGWFNSVFEDWFGSSGNFLRIYVLFINQSLSRQFKIKRRWWTYTSCCPKQMWLWLLLLATNNFRLRNGYFMDYSLVMVGHSSVKLDFR